MYIYKITNLVNNKVYIGKTKRTNPKRRWNEHVSHAFNKSRKGKRMVISRAIRKYGKENFKFEVLHKCLNGKELALWETETILKNNSLVPKGYNVVLESEDQIITNLHRQNMRKAQQGIKKQKSGYVGVTKNKKRYIVDVRNKNGKRYLKGYNNPIKAAITYDKLVLYLYGKQARLNFENRREKYLKKDLKLFCLNLKSNSYTSNYNGVFYQIDVKRWIASFPVWKNNKLKRYTKYCKTEIEAAEKYDLFCLYLNGDKNLLNFPEKLNFYKTLDLYKILFLKEKKVRIKKIRKPAKGVYFRKNRNRYMVFFKHKERIYIKSFLTLGEAENHLKLLKTELGIII